MLGLIALALQFAISLGHHHDDDDAQPGYAAAAAQAVHGVAPDGRALFVALHAPAGEAPRSEHAGGEHHDRMPGHGEGGACDICWLRSHAQQAALLAQPLPAVQPVSYQRISYNTKPQARPVILWRMPVQARAPPLTASV